MADRRTRVLTMALAAGVAVAFADSSIVVLALPDLYGEFDTTLVGVSWVITSYNLVVAVAAFCLVPFARRLRPRPTGIVGIGALRRRLGGLRGSVEPRRPHRLSLPAGARRRAVAGGVAAGLAAFAGTPARGAAVWTRPGRSAPPRAPRSAAC